MFFALVVVGSSVASGANIVLIGDSTLAPRSEAVKTGGWGDALKPFLAPGNGIVNRSVGGRTVRAQQVAPYLWRLREGRGQGEEPCLRGHDGAHRRRTRQVGQGRRNRAHVGETTRDNKPIFDTTHPAKTGAKRFAELFVADVKARDLPIAKLFK